MALNTNVSLFSSAKVTTGHLIDLLIRHRFVMLGDYGQDDFLYCRSRSGCRYCIYVKEPKVDYMEPDDVALVNEQSIQTELIIRFDEPFLADLITLLRILLGHFNGMVVSNYGKITMYDLNTLHLLPSDPLFCDS